jgi:hypothetical protein
VALSLQLQDSANAWLHSSAPIPIKYVRNAIYYSEPIAHTLVYTDQETRKGPTCMIIYCAIVYLLPILTLFIVRYV